ncbi:hypothetical protein G7046_g7636 [Stylonectria norvegica]|nr:hypothetical protein G7046_g7636 [Stylonectria norvegica]
MTTSSSIRTGNIRTIETAGGVGSFPIGIIARGRSGNVTLGAVLGGSTRQHLRIRGRSMVRSDRRQAGHFSMCSGVLRILRMELPLVDRNRTGPPLDHEDLGAAVVAELEPSQVLGRGDGDSDRDRAIFGVGGWQLACRPRSARGRRGRQRIHFIVWVSGSAGRGKAGRGVIVAWVSMLVVGT